MVNWHPLEGPGRYRMTFIPQERPCRVLYLRLLHDLQLLRCLGRMKWNHRLGETGLDDHIKWLATCILFGQLIATSQHLGLLKMEQVDANRKGNGTPAISGKSRLVRYCNLARYTIWYLVMWWVMVPDYGILLRYDFNELYLYFSSRYLTFLNILVPPGGSRL